MNPNNKEIIKTAKDLGEALGVIGVEWKHPNLYKYGEKLELVGYNDLVANNYDAYEEIGAWLDNSELNPNTSGKVLESFGIIEDVYLFCGNSSDNGKSYQVDLYLKHELYATKEPHLKFFENWPIFPTALDYIKAITKVIHRAEGRKLLIARLEASNIPQVRLYGGFKLCLDESDMNLAGQMLEQMKKHKHYTKVCGIIESTPTWNMPPEQTEPYQDAVKNSGLMEIG